MRRLTLSGFRTIWFGLLVLVLLGTGLRAAHADELSDSQSLLEEPRSRQGYWIGFGASGIAARLTEDGKNRGVYSGWTGTFRIGQLITRRLGLGLLVEYIGGISKGSDKGSLGGLIMEGSYLAWIDTSLRGGGGSYLLLGASYDLFPFKKRLTGGWAFTPVVDLHIMPDGSIHFFSLLAGLQVTWWSGLPNNMLRLPEE
jgi:hypothetical protein